MHTLCFLAHIAASELRMTDLFIKNRNKNLSQITMIKVREFCRVIEYKFSLKKYIDVTIKVFSKMSSKILLKTTFRHQVTLSDFLGSYCLEELLQSTYNGIFSSLENGNT